MRKRRESKNYEVGYGKPPVPTRYPKGKSGNPKGRPRGRKKELPYDAVLGQMVTIREDGVERRVTAAEAFVLHTTKRGLEGDGAAARDAMAAIMQARAARGLDPRDHIDTIIFNIVSPGSVNPGLTALRMAKKIDPYRPNARMGIEPWLVQQALERLGNRRLTREEQAKVVNATRTPHKVTWPDWWEVMK